MKKITCLFAIIFSFSLLMGACSSEEFGESAKVENEISVIEAISLPFDFEGADSRTIINMGNTSIDLPVWAEGDTIGIYPSAGGDQLSFPIIDGIGTNICVFSGGGWALKASTANETYKYTAYTPFNRSYYQLKDNTALPFSMLGQKQKGNNNSNHLGAYDLQIANGNTPTSGKIEFSFQHKVAIVRMDITAPCAATWKSITLESTAAFTTKAAINLSLATPTVTPTTQSNSVTLELENVKTTADNLSIVAYMMMLPVDFTDKMLNMTLKDAEDNIYTMPVTFKNPTNISNPRKLGEANPRWIAAEFTQGVAPTIPYVTFMADAGQTLTMSKVVSSLEYSVNGGDWTTLETTMVTFGGEYGDLRLRGQSSVGTNGAQVKFGNESLITCTGDIRTLIDYKNYKTVSTESARFEKLFENCSSLTSAPALPATTLANNCYYYMFYGCTGLTQAPALPATTLASSCYSCMFLGCTGLTQAPALPATTLASCCYNGMFVCCTGLTQAPVLPATTLVADCYFEMLSNCSNLQNVTMLATDISESDCLTYWLSGVSSKGTFTKAASMTSLPEGDSGIPAGWTVENYTSE